MLNNEIKVVYNGCIEATWVDTIVKGNDVLAVLVTGDGSIHLEHIYRIKVIQ